MKKNIAIIVPKLTGGGAEKVASNLSTNLSLDGNTNLIVFNNETITYDYSANLIPLKYKKRYTIIGILFTFVERITLIKKIKKKYNIDVSISFMEYPNFINILSRRKDKLIVSVRIYKSASTNSFKGKLNKILMKLLYNKADYIVAVSEQIKTDLIKNFGVQKEKIKVIYNSYNIKEINDLCEESLESSYSKFFNGTVITNVGRLETQKGQKYLLKAFAKIKKEIPDAKLLIIGEGSLKEELNKLAYDLNVSKDVKLIGYKKNPFKYIKRSSLFVFPSLFEGFPNALCEAMACGVPVISADCKSGPREILYKNYNESRVIKNIEYADYGLIVPFITATDKEINDYKYVNDLAHAMNVVLGNERLYEHYSSRALSRVKEFSVESHMKEWKKLL